MEAPTIIEGGAIEEEVHTKYLLPPSRNKMKQSDSETSKHKSVQSPQFENIFSQANQSVMTPE